MHFRQARTSDRSAIRSFFDRLSPATVQARYLSPLGGLWRDRELRRTLERNEAEHFVVLAVQETEVRGIGEFVAVLDKRADVGLVVEDAFQGRGIGRSLFQSLERLAVERGIRAFTGDVAYGNARAVAILRGTGRKLQIQVSYGTLQFALQLD